MSQSPCKNNVLVHNLWALSQLLNISKYGVFFILYIVLIIDKKGDCKINPATGYSFLQAKSNAIPVPKENPYIIIWLGLYFKLLII